MGDGRGKSSWGIGKGLNLDEECAGGRRRAYGSKRPPMLARELISMQVPCTV